MKTGAFRPRRLIVAATAGALALGACGGDDGSSSTTTPVATSAASGESSVTTAATASSSTAPAATSAPGGAEPGTPPTFNELGWAVCDGGIGYAGNPVYDGAAPGPHAIALFATPAAGYSVLPVTDRNLPEWSLIDRGTPASAELVGCMAELSRTARGIECEFPFSDGSEQMLPVFDATYELTVRVAQTGELLQTTELTATSDGCPARLRFLANVTEYVNEVSDDALIAALAPVVGS